MRKIAIFISLATLTASMLFAANDEIRPFRGKALKSAEVKNAASEKPAQHNTRHITDVVGVTTDYQVSVQPTALIDTYYDYVPGGYQGSPVRVLPDGSVYMSFQAQASASAERLSYVAGINSDGTSAGCRATNANAGQRQGFPQSAYNYRTGNAAAVWHQEVNDNPDDLDVIFCYDMLSWDSTFRPGSNIFSTFAIVNNSEIDANPNVTPNYNDGVDPYPWSTSIMEKNTFIWPYIYIGPSPLGENYSRYYIDARNSTSHNQEISDTSGDPYASSNHLFGYADVSSDDEENDLTDLDWHFRTFPELDAYNHAATGQWASGDLMFTVGTGVNEGKVALAGRISGYDYGVDDNKLMVYYSNDYGQNWTLYCASNSAQRAPEAPGLLIYAASDSLLFSDINPNPRLDDFGGASNIVFDSNGNLHSAAVFALIGDSEDGDPTAFTYYRSTFMVKSYVFRPEQGGTAYVQDLWPFDNGHQNDSAFGGSMFKPWDANSDGQQDFYWSEASETRARDITACFPSTVWDIDSHPTSVSPDMHIKFSTNNDNNWMAAVWTDAFFANAFGDDGLTYYSSWSDKAMMQIALSNDGGNSWTAPIALHNNGTVIPDTTIVWEGYEPSLAGINPTYPYPADKIIDVSAEHGAEPGTWGRLYLMFLDDHVYGSSIQSYSLVGNGGRIMYMGVDFNMSFVDANDNQTPTPVATGNILKSNYPNPFNPSTTIRYDVPVAGKMNLSVYNVKGQLVKTLINSQVAKGENSIVWNGKDNSGRTAASGVYFYRVSLNGKSETRKMLLVK